jgi:hypothetical protein
VGFKYGNKAGTPEGLTNLLLKGGSRPAQITAKGKGTNLALPTLPFTTPVRMQLKRGDTTGGCWEAVYSHAVVNVAGGFKAKSD